MSLRTLLIAVAALAASWVWSAPARSDRVDVGSQAPPFALLGGLATDPDVGEPALIAFLDFSEAESLDGDGQSAEEAEAVRSMASWRGTGGVRAVVIDAGPTVTGRTSAIATLSARAKAWGIDGVPIVQDHLKAGLARRYGVTQIPCVFLVDSGGIVRARWDREVDAVEIAARLASVGASLPGARGAAVR